MDTTRPSLLIRVRNRGDQSAWYEFDSIYRPLMQRFARARGLSEGEAEEIAQQCMTVVDRHIGGFEYDPQRGKFKSWLSTMVNNRVRNLLRDRREVDGRSEDFENLAGRDGSPDEIFDKLWRQEHLKHCLRLIRSEVEPTTFDAFVAYVMEEQPVEQVCERFGLKANQVHAIKSRMTRRIRQRMIDLLGEEE